MIVVLILSSVWNLVYAVGIGLVIASILFMKKIGDLTATASNVSGLESAVDIDTKVLLEDKVKSKVYVKQLDGPLFFGTTSEFQALAQQIPDSSAVVIIRMEKVNYIDQSGLYAMEDVLIDLICRGNIVLITKLVKQPRYMFERVDIIPNLIPNNQIFDSYEESLKWIKDNVY